MGISSSTNRWRLSRINEEYELCPTYPSILAVPTSTSDSVLVVASKFRSKGRIPVLSWRDRHTGAVICRSSQPLVGLGQKQCDKDVFLIQAIAATNPSSTKLVIIDARPWKNAVAQKTVGRAGESSLVLTECKLIFMGIENIHAMRKSYHKLMDLCTTKQSNDKWLDQLASTHWMDHISRILDSAVEIVRIVKEQKCSVLIHCSDGWDRTAQLTSLTELLIDPYYRTIRGFEVLIEKEWCSFGHKFRDRTGHGSSNSSNETSPVFLQWIDCVWQVLVQSPSAFEFNERYLILILDHLYSCRFGTFLYDSQRERVEQESLHPTQSLWSYLSTVDRAIIVNPFYQSQSAPRMKWKASVTATRQCFERTSGDEYESHMIPHMTHNDFEVHSLMDEVQDYRKARSFDSSDESSNCSSPSSVAFGSTVAVASSPSQSIDAEVNVAIKSTHTQLAQELQHHRADLRMCDSEIDSSDGSDDSDVMLHQLACFHKLVRDLDSGFSFPQPLEISGLTSFPSSPSAAPRSRLFSRQSAEDGGAGRATTPKRRSSLSSLFMPAVERPTLSSEAMWSAFDTDAVSDGDEIGRYGVLASCEDVIVPSCSMKALRFWSHYYLRWDPTSNFDRDVSVEIESLHLDLLMKLETLTRRLDSVRGDEAVRWERKLQRFAYGRGRAGTTDSLTILEKPQLPDRRAISNGSTSSQDSMLSVGSAPRVKNGASLGSAATLEEQIALLQEQKRHNLEEVETNFQKQLAQLLSASSPPQSAEQ
ncbi:hypothetical protein BBJ29_002602 [Phytophthora kernoviae]|uniref:Myotubularin phosphatase domain-containing protein n=1 Tax=Phytophthora kernoviae TaxID=325452 RepID=A0A3F2RXR7_9STRA|nr:hypothetical protein BBP00_00002284 [Phytophthora kernoviae]RLN71619.1 hypothetical protein BBJ29_002602 [Phytophthora kernoviae]